MPRLACVFIAETLAEAQQVRRRLADYGIEATVQDDRLGRDAGRNARQGGGAGHSATRSPSAEIRVLVVPEDFEFSQEVVEEFEAKRRPRYGRSRSGPARDADSDTLDGNNGDEGNNGDDGNNGDEGDEGEYAPDNDADHGEYGNRGHSHGGHGNREYGNGTASEVAADWPRCPQCRRPRLAICPACQTAGSRFRLAGDHSGSSAWLGSASSLARPLLVCSTCDHPFTPEFYRRCEGCGHEFPDGLDAPRATPVEEAARQGGTFLAALGMFAAALYIAWRLLR